MIEFVWFRRRYNYTTPKSFLELIYLYRNMLAKERTTLTSDIDRLSNGLDKLETTSKDVALLEEEIKVKSVEVEAAKEQADQIAEKVGGEKAKVEVAAAGANDEAAKCAVIAENAGKMEADCTRDLEAAIPAVQKAEAALDSLKKKELDELKSLGKPPGGVDDVTNAILAIKGEPKKNWDWNNAKLMMNKVEKFIEELKGLKAVIDNGQMPAKNIEAARPMLALEHIQNVEIMKKKSNAAAGTFLHK
jgi:dynein heavy chain